MSKNSDKGSAFERQTRDYLSECGFDTYRPRAGSDRDTGDLTGITLAGRPLYIDCKNHARDALGVWLNSIQAKAARDAAFAGVIVHKRRGVGNPAGQYVTLSLGDFANILALAASATHR